MTNKDKNIALLILVLVTLFFLVPRLKETMDKIFRPATEIKIINE